MTAEISKKRALIALLSWCGCTSIGLHYKISSWFNSVKHEDDCRYIFSVFPRQLKLECRRTDTVMLHKFIMISYDTEHVSIAQHCFIGVYQMPHIIVLNCCS